MKHKKPKHTETGPPAQQIFCLLPLTHAMAGTVPAALAAGSFQRLKSPVQYFATPSHPKAHDAKLNQGYRARHYHLNEPGKFQGEEKAHRFNQLLYKGLAEQMITLNQAALLRNITVGALRNDIDQLA